LSQLNITKYLKDYAFLFSITGLILAFDQWTKYLVRANVPFGGQWAPWDWLMPYARIVHWQNTGAAFGILQQFGGVFGFLAIVVSIGIVIYFPRVPAHEWWLRLAMAMQCGGALGNLIDRLARGYVTDFISVGNFAVFNVADSCISVGTAVLVVGMWWTERALQREKEAQGQSVEAEQAASEQAPDTFEADAPLDADPARGAGDAPDAGGAPGVDDGPIQEPPASSEEPFEH